jgi:hypothetical protein
MRKIGWVLAALGSAAVLSMAAVQGVATASPGHSPAHVHSSALLLRFDTMTPVTGPYVGTTNPLPEFQAILSCQSIGAGNSAAIANVTTGDSIVPGGDQLDCPGNAGAHPGRTGRPGRPS